MRDKWRYFTREGYWPSSIVLWAANEHNGHLFKREGILYGSGYGITYNQFWKNDVPEVPQEKAFELISKKGIKNVCNVLGIPFCDKSVKLTKSGLDKIVDFLLKEKATNGDCAYTPNDEQFPFLYKMEELGIVKCSVLDNGMFYLDKDYKSKIEQFKDIT